MEPAGAHPAPVHSARKPRWVAAPPASRLPTRRASDDDDRTQRRPGIRALGWPARGGGRTGARRSRRHPRHGGRIPRRRRVLRAQRFPDHLAAAGRTEPHRPHRPGQLLDSPRPPPAAGADPDGADGGRRAPVLRPRGDRQPARRRRRRLLLGGELDVRRRQDRLLRPGNSTFAAATRLVAGRRRAVLHRLAAGVGRGGRGFGGPRAAPQDAGPPSAQSG